jgi:hypothetical protein
MLAWQNIVDIDGAIRCLVPATAARIIRTRRARLPDRSQILDSVAADSLEVAGSVTASAELKAAIWIGDECCGAIAKTFKLLPGQLLSAERIYDQTKAIPNLPCDGSSSRSDLSRAQCQASLSHKVIDLLNQSTRRSNLPTRRLYRCAAEHVRPVAPFGECCPVPDSREKEASFVGH